MIDIEIKSEGYEELLKYFRFLPERITKGALSAMYKSLEAVRTTAINKAPKYTGHLTRAIQQETSGSGASDLVGYVFVAPALKYSWFVEEGSEKMTQKTDGGSFERIRDWVIWKGINPVKTVPIYRKIAEKGIEEQQFMRKTAEQEQALVDMLFREEIEKLKL